MQLDLFDHASVARRSDPVTSQIAAANVEPQLNGLRAQFVERLRQIGEPSTAQEISGGSESIRKRAKECLRLGVVRDAGTRRCRVTGKVATVYWLTE